MSGDKSKRNSVSKPNHQKKDSKSKSQPQAQKDAKKQKDVDGDEEMTVVVPPTKPLEGNTNKDMDVAMNGTDEKKSEDVVIDPKVKAAAGVLIMSL